MSHTAQNLTFIKEAIPVLYNYPAGIPKSQWRSSYACKHDVEHLLGIYFTNDEFKQAGVEFGLLYKVGDLTPLQREYHQNPNYGFAVKPRFPMEWLRSLKDLTVRPLGARKTEWAAYLDALRWRDATLATQESLSLPVG